MAATTPESSEVPDDRRVVLGEAPASGRDRPEAFGIGTLFWRLADGLAVVDPRSSEVVLWNPAAEALFGYACAEVVGRPASLVLPAGLPPGAPSMTAFATTGRHRDGRALTLEVSLSPVERVAGAGTRRSSPRFARPRSGSWRASTTSWTSPASRPGRSAWTSRPSTSRASSGTSPRRWAPGPRSPPSTSGPRAPRMP